MLVPESPGARRNELFGIAHIDTLLDGEIAGAARHEHGQRTLQDRPRQDDRVEHSRHGAHRPGGEPRAIHDPGVALHVPIPIQERPVPGVEGLVVLERDHGALDRVEGGTPRPEHVEPELERSAAPDSMGLEQIQGQEPGAPVDGHRDHVPCPSVNG